ncbi:hypothetical protein NQ317_012510, partial [Molorchus minor]
KGCKKSLAGTHENPVIYTENGPVVGQKNYSVGQNKTYYAFRGIPYAEPPTGNLRFRVRSEDCLFINVYTPNVEAVNLSVIVWIYGGAFVSGSASYDSYAPDYLLDEDVVFVSFNYRVGIFGFLSTGDEACPGNWALKDQVLALEWVRDNIAFFGGNADNVTVLGQSAGAASVHYLLQTNKTRGLFNAAIMHSGSSLNLWALNRRAQTTAFSVGASLGISTTNSSSLVEALRKIGYEQLQTTSFITSTLVALGNALEGLFYGPVIEPECEGALFVYKSDQLLSEGHFHRVPVIMGFTSNEASAVGNIPSILRIYLLGYDLQPDKYAPADLTNIIEDRQEAGTIIKEHYFGPDGGASLDLDAAVKFVSDDQFNRPIRRAVLDQSKYVPVYLYEFSHQGPLSGIENRPFSGVGHAEDISYIFRSPVANVTEADEVVSSRMIRMWTNFVKHGNPTPKEDPLLKNITWIATGSNSSALNYLNIGSELALLKNPFEESMTFYDEIYSEYGDPPYDTY